jgi:hypothetical protein
MSTLASISKSVVNPRVRSVVLPPYLRPLPAPLIAAVLDDPDTGLLVYDKNLRPVLISSQVLHFLGIPAELRVDHLDVLQLLSIGELDSVSSASAETRILQASIEHVEPILLQTRGNAPREICMKLRCVGSEYRIVSFEDAGKPSQGRVQRASASDVADWLTGLASRFAFENALKDALAHRRGEPLER